MKTDPLEILKGSIDDSELGGIAREALSMLEGATVKSTTVATEGQSAQSIADMHKLRRQLGYYKQTLTGLDETIERLRSVNALVRLAVIETDRGVIAMWVTDEHGPLGGILVGKYPQHQAQS